MTVCSMIVALALFDTLTYVWVCVCVWSPSPPSLKIVAPGIATLHLRQEVGDYIHVYQIPQCRCQTSFVNK